ncbi:MAG: hypothetical protein RIA65_04680, partial [Woeseia sp.]
MTLETVIIDTAAGVQKLGTESLPIRIGTGTDCELRLPGPGSSVVATLDQLDGKAFLQPGVRGSDMQING